MDDGARSRFLAGVERISRLLESESWEGMHIHAKALLDHSTAAAFEKYCGRPGVTAIRTPLQAIRDTTPKLLRIKDGKVAREGGWFMGRPVSKETLRDRIADATARLVEATQKYLK